MSVCACGCGEAIPARTKEGKPQRFVWGHNGRNRPPAPRPTAAPIERVWRHVDRAGDCWLWTGWIDGTGYGRIREGRRQLRVHRVVWESLHGPVPAGRCVMHACDTPACVRPDHLRLGTWAENNADRAAKGRSGYAGRPGASHHNAKLTDDAVSTIRRLRAEGRTLQSIGDQLGVSQSTVWGVLNGRVWTHVGAH